MSKVRIYDLAKELKLESKKVLEDARRLGVDVSVPSNTLDDATAAKIREMYYPKKKEVVAAKPTARLIKHHPTATAPALEKTPETHEPIHSAAPVIAEAPDTKHAEVSTPPTPSTVIKQLTRPIPTATQPQPAVTVEPKIESKVESKPESKPEPSVIEPKAKIGRAHV